jgi:hypothetical protein
MRSLPRQARSRWNGSSPSPSEAVGQGNHEPPLVRGEPGDQPGQLPELSLINDRCLHVSVLIRWCMSAPNVSSLIVDR